ncbi:MAG: hypothetical protein V9E98_11315 [Candidatus Nanopelagicales bacterium]
MRKSVIALAATPILVLGLSSCSGSPDAQAKVDEYCQKVKELSQQAKVLDGNTKQAEAKKLQKDAEALAGQASELAGAVISDPLLAQQILECSQQAAEILQQGS